MVPGTGRKRILEMSHKAHPGIAKMPGGMFGGRGWTVRLRNV